MKLYYSPGSCSLAPHIVAREAGLEIQLEKVDLRSKKTGRGADFTGVSPKGYVPALELDDGSLLTEGPVISQFLADRRPDAGLAPPHGTMERYRLQEILGFVNSEIHKSYHPLFDPRLPAERREEIVGHLTTRYALVEKTLTGRPFLTGETFTIADAYLFALTGWARHVKLDLGAFPSLLAFQERVAARPAVRAAMKQEGLLRE